SCTARTVNRWSSRFSPITSRCPARSSRRPSTRSSSSWRTSNDKPGSSTHRTSRSYFVDRRHRARQLEEEHRAARLVAAIADAPAIRFDDAAADGETEAGTLTDRTGGEERLEELRFVSRRHAWTVVDDFEPEARTGIGDANHDQAVAAAAR